MGMYIVLLTKYKQYNFNIKDKGNVSLNICQYLSLKIMGTYNDYRRNSYFPR
jgi:hypothetical protein